jgi:hypothetical protein
MKKRKRERMIQKIKRVLLVPKTFLMDPVLMNSSFPKRTKEEDVQLIPQVKIS